MNKELCVTRGRNREKVKKAQKRYLAQFKQFNILLHLERDADIISWINKQSNKQETIRSLMRNEAEHGNQNT